MHTGEKTTKLIHPALILFSSGKYMEEFFLDVKLYLESHVICSNAEIKAFLITDDHRFFRFLFFFSTFGGVFFGMGLRKSLTLGVYCNRLCSCSNRIFVLHSSVQLCATCPVHRSSVQLCASHPVHRPSFFSATVCLSSSPLFFSAAMTTSRLSKYCLDTNVVPLLLNRELWRCVPYNMM